MAPTLPHLAEWHRRQSEAHAQRARNWLATAARLLDAKAHPNPGPWAQRYLDAAESARADAEDHAAFARLCAGETN